MSVFRSIAWIKYRWKARGRHGTHSPFIYALVERVLFNKAPVPFTDKLQQYLPDYKIIAEEAYLDTLAPKTILICSDIHKDNHNEMEWNRYISQNRNYITIDLFHQGLIIANPDIYQAQHFILKCRFK